MESLDAGCLVRRPQFFWCPRFHRVVTVVIECDDECVSVVLQYEIDPTKDRFIEVRNTFYSKEYDTIAVFQFTMEYRNSLLRPTSFEERGLKYTSACPAPSAGELVVLLVTNV